jgi:hypothetical protein
LNEGDERRQVLARLVRLSVFLGANVGLTTAQVLQHLHGLRHDAPRPVPLVHQTLDDAQLFHLRHRVDTLAMDIPFRHRKTIATLPDPQRVFANAGIAFDRCNRQHDL